MTPGSAFVSTVDPFAAEPRCISTISPGTRALEHAMHGTGGRLRRLAHPAERVHRPADGDVSQAVTDRERSRVTRTVRKPEQRTGVASRRTPDHDRRRSDLV